MTRKDWVDNYALPFLEHNGRYIKGIVLGINLAWQGKLNLFGKSARSKAIKNLGDALSQDLAKQGYTPEVADIIKNKFEKVIVSNAGLFSGDLNSVKFRIGLEKFAFEFFKESIKVKLPNEKELHKNLEKVTLNDITQLIDRYHRDVKEKGLALTDKKVTDEIFEVLDKNKDIAKDCATKAWKFVEASISLDPVKLNHLPKRSHEGGKHKGYVKASFGKQQLAGCLFASAVIVLGISAFMICAGKIEPFNKMLTGFGLGENTSKLAKIIAPLAHYCAKSAKNNIGRNINNVICYTMLSGLTGLGFCAENNLLDKSAGIQVEKLKDRIFPKTNLSPS